LLIKRSFNEGGGLKGTKHVRGLNRERDTSTTVLPFHPQAHMGYKIIQLDLNLLRHMATEIAGSITLCFSELRVEV
jgi:hypothetical protein